MKKILLFLLLVFPIVAKAQLELPFPIKLVNSSPVDFWYFESDGTPYDNTGEVTTQVLSAIRYIGQTFNVNGVEYWFGAGIADVDLVIKSTAGNLTGAVTSTGLATSLGSFTSNALGTAISDPVRTVTGTDAIVQADNGRTIYFNSATPFNFTIDALTINTFTMFRNIGIGTVNFVDGSGVTSTGATELLADEVGGVEYIASTTPIISVVGSGGGDMVLASTQTNSGAKTFLNGTFKLRNVANTFDGIFSNTNTADRTYTLPNASGTVALTSYLSGWLTGSLTGTVSLNGADTQQVNFGTSTVGTKLNNFKVYVSSTGSDAITLSAGVAGADGSMIQAGDAIRMTSYNNLGDSYNVYHAGTRFSISQYVAAGGVTTDRFIITPSNVTFNLGSDATGDTYYRNSSGYFTRLAAGTNGHVLTLASGIPSWAAPSGGGGGDVVGPSSSVAGTLALFDGTTGKLLKEAVSATNRVTSDGGQILFEKVSSVTGNNLIRASNGGAGENHAMGLLLLGGNASGSNYDGGDVIIQSGNPHGSGAKGAIQIADSADKLGFFEVTPVVKQSAPTTAQGIADVLTAYGLIPTSTISGGGGSGLTYSQVSALSVIGN